MDETQHPVLCDAGASPAYASASASPSTLVFLQIADHSAKQTGSEQIRSSPALDGGQQAVPWLDVVSSAMNGPVAREPSSTRALTRVRPAARHATQRATRTTATVHDDCKRPPHVDPGSDESFVIDTKPSARLSLFEFPPTRPSRGETPETDAAGRRRSRASIVERAGEGLDRAIDGWHKGRLPAHWPQGATIEKKQIWSPACLMRSRPANESRWVSAEPPQPDSPV